MNAQISAIVEARDIQFGAKINVYCTYFKLI